MDMASMLQPVLDAFKTGLTTLIPAALIIGGAVFGIRKGYGIIKGLAGK